jgi:hypothetical protein
MIVFFGLSTMTHKPGELMVDNCPLSVAGESLCPQNSVADAIHHISSYESFFAVTVNSNQTILLTTILFVMLAFVLVSIYPYLLNFSSVVNYLYDSPPVFLATRKIRHWLSLFENSPSIA